MSTLLRSRLWLVTLTAVAASALAEGQRFVQPGQLEEQSAVLWREPNDINGLDLYYGRGGKKDQPSGEFTFVKEDLDGTQPKFVVIGSDGVKWKAKLGPESGPETAATRLIWAVGYYADEDYFVRTLDVKDLPPRLHRGQNFVGTDGRLTDVRLKRYSNTEKKIGIWEWFENPFVGRREFNGLRTLMALLNNWDLTDENNAVYRDELGGWSVAHALIYGVSDVGSTFGAGELVWPTARARGNLHAYRESKFLVKITAESVSFHSPHRDSLLFLATPREYFQKLKLRWIGQHVPREDAKWMGQILGSLSPNQIRDAFRAAGYSSEDSDGFAAVVLDRIRQLQQL